MDTTTEIRETQKRMVDLWKQWLTQGTGRDYTPEAVRQSNAWQLLMLRLEKAYDDAKAQDIADNDSSG